MNEICEEQAYNLWQRVNYTGKKESLIGHSMGGLIAINVAQKHPGLIDKVITLGAPIKGTKAAHIVSFLKPGEQMTPNSKFLQEMAEEGLPEQVDFYTINSYDEHLIIPARNALLDASLDNVRNLPAPGNIGHARLITLHDMILDCLRQPTNTNASEL
jgi:pimeloyl-ACP methyl ester carboxylesterase